MLPTSPINPLTGLAMSTGTAPPPPITPGFWEGNHTVSHCQLHTINIRDQFQGLMEMGQYLCYLGLMHTPTIKLSNI